MVLHSVRASDSACTAIDEHAPPNGHLVHPWPTLSYRALHGVVGEIVEAACRRSEADPVAVLASCLAWLGASVGPEPHLKIGDTRHPARLFFAKVGASSRARKGTSEAPVQRIFRCAEALQNGGSALPPLPVSPGPLSTGEGILRAVRDPGDELDDDGAPLDPGVADKRLLVIEGELGAPLKAAQREGNTLSAILRTLWDSGDAAPLTKSNRLRVTGAHVLLVGHITRPELTDLLQRSDIWNGLANRILWLCVRRPKMVPVPETMSDSVVTALARSLRDIIAHARTASEVTWSNEAKEFWIRLYPYLSVDHPGAFGAVTARAEAQIQRLALLYALIDRSATIEYRHLLASVAVWDYARDSACLIFGGASQDPVCEKVIAALRAGPLTQTELNGCLSGHVPGARLKGALEDLQACGQVSCARDATGGRPVTRWSLCDLEKAGKAKEPSPSGVSTTSSASSAYIADESLVARLERLERERAEVRLQMLGLQGS